nr:hypothetical protein [Polynucleobacter alcilacus]
MHQSIHLIFKFTNLCLKTRNFIRADIGREALLCLILLQRNEVTSYFEGGHHTGAFNATITTTNGQLNLLINQYACFTK